VITVVLFVVVMVVAVVTVSTTVCVGARTVAVRARMTSETAEGAENGRKRGRSRDLGASDACALLLEGREEAAASEHTLEYGKVQGFEDNAGRMRAWSSVYTR